MPELVANGPNIPVQLLNELDSGSVVFFCGSGVSTGQGSELPDFEGLVERVYTENNFHPDEAEKTALDFESVGTNRRRPNFDKALGLLEKNDRLGALALRKTVVDCLSTPPTGPLEVHRALVKLSKREERVRLVTTNFDNRFWETEQLEEQFIDAAPKLPVPKPHGWSSLVHLHGRIAPNEDGSSLVLTAADFGRAYLTERWASRFVTELFREFTVVFVGYGINDPVIGYLVDALAAERAKGARFTSAYAFAGCDSASGSTQRTESEWLVKNVEPILYDQQDNHCLLAETLIEWARIRDDPFQARTLIAINGITKMPTARSDPIVERVIWALQNSVAAQALADEPPLTDPDDHIKIGKWLEIFAEEGLLGCVPNKDGLGTVNNAALVQVVDHGHQSIDANNLDSVRYHLARWIAQHLHVPEVLTWVVRSGGHMHPALKRMVRDRLAEPESNIPGTLRLYWTVLLNHEPLDPLKHPWTVQHYHQSESTSERHCIEDAVIRHLKPRLVVVPGPNSALLYRLYTNRNPRELTPIDTCGHLKLVSGDSDSWRQLQDLLKCNEVLARNAERLTDHLEAALELCEAENTMHGIAMPYRPSIANHDQNLDRDDWAHLIDLARDSYFALAETNPASANHLLRRWVLTKRCLFHRLALHALSENAKSDIQLARPLLLSGRKPGVWELETRREVLRFFKKAGSRLPRSLRAEIVRTIHSGPKGKRMRPQLDDPESLQYEKALRLHQLALSGAKLDKKSLALAEKARRNARESRNERDEFLGWHDEGGWIAQEDFAPKSLLEGTVRDVAEAIKSSSITQDQFRGIVLKQPEKAVRALEHVSQQEDCWPEEFWRGFFWELSRLRERASLEGNLLESVAAVLEVAPEIFFRNVDSDIADFVSILAEAYETGQECDLNTLWTRAWNSLSNGPPQTIDLGDPLTDSLNDAAGKLASAALTRLWKYKPEVGAGLPLPVREYFDLIADAPAARLGRVMLATNLYRIFAIDPEWTKNQLISRLDPTSSDEASDLWSGYCYSPSAGPDLIFALKGSFLKMLRCGQDSDSRRANLIGLFVTICLEAPSGLTEEEIREVVGSFSEEALSAVLTRLRWLLKGTSQQKGTIWREKAHPWLRDCWPAATSRNTAATSIAMVEMLAECGDAFCEAVAWASSFLQPIEERGLYCLRQNGHAKTYPQSVLQILHMVVNRMKFPIHEKVVLRDILEEMRNEDGGLASNTQFQTLYGIATT